MTLADLYPDEVLATLLDGKVQVQSSATEKYAIKAYAQAKMPNKGLADEFLSVQNNGVITSLTNQLGLCKGSLALTLYSKAEADGTARTALLSRMMAQCVALVDHKTARGFFFQLDPNNVITPPTVNLTTGYATTVINVKWRESR